ncbi:MAG: hypothetical protein ACTS6J_16630, partial [Burkholderiales bacterium]
CLRSACFVLWRTQVRRDQAKLLQRRLQVVDDFLRNHFGRWQVVGVGERMVPEPEDVEAGFVAGDEFVIGVRAPAAIRVLR